MIFRAIGVCFVVLVFAVGCARLKVLDLEVRPNVYRVEVYDSCTFCSYDTPIEEFYKRIEMLCGDRPYQNTLLKTSGTRPLEDSSKHIIYTGSPFDMNFPQFDALVTGEVYCGSAVQSIILEAKKGNRIKVLGLIEEGANLDAIDAESRTALMYASMNGYFKIAKDLLASGADISLRDKENNSALSHAIKSEQEDIVKVLKANGEK